MKEEKLFFSCPGIALFHFRENSDSAVRWFCFRQLLPAYVSAHKSHKLPGSLTKYSKWKFGFFDVLKRLLVFDKHFSIWNALFFKKERMVWQNNTCFMYRRIWFPLVVYYKLALVQIRIYWQQHMVGKEVFGTESNSIPSHKLYKVPKTLSTFCPKIPSTKIWKNSISSSNDFCCF